MFFVFCFRKYCSRLKVGCTDDFYLLPRLKVIRIFKRFAPFCGPPSRGGPGSFRREPRVLTAATPGGRTDGAFRACS